MNSAQRIGWSLLAWLAVGAFWLLTTRNFHPTWALALITTGSLVTAYALASYANHLLLIPRYLHAGFLWKYLAALLGVMVVLTGLALTVLRISYIRALGPNSVRSLEVDFGIDLLGMGVHLAGAAGVVWAVGEFARRRSYIA